MPKKDMTIKDLRFKKKQMEKVIEDNIVCAMNKFFCETGYQVSGITVNMRHIDISTMVDPEPVYMDWIASVNIDVDILD